MITGDPTDTLYAQACLEIVGTDGQLAPSLINQKFIETGNRYYPNFDGPKNLMLQIIFDGVQFDELNPEYELSDYNEAAGRYRMILSDYLAGRYYPTYYSLSGAYGDEAMGYSWDVSIRNQDWIVRSGNPAITTMLHHLTADVELSDDNHSDLALLQKRLPASMQELSLSSSVLRELLQ